MSAEEDLSGFKDLIKYLQEQKHPTTKTNLRKVLKKESFFIFIFPLYFSPPMPHNMWQELNYVVAVYLKI